MKLYVQRVFFGLLQRADKRTALEPSLYGTGRCKTAGHSQCATANEAVNDDSTHERVKQAEFHMCIRECRGILPT